MEPTQSSETSAYNVRTPGKYPEDNFSSFLLAIRHMKNTKNKEIISKECIFVAVNTN